MTTRHDELYEAARSFHCEHPHVWRLFCQFTFELIDRGFKHYSPRGVFERIRWETAEADTGEQEFKINNNHAAFYSRWFRQDHPQHAGFYRERKQTSKSKDPVCMAELGPKDYD